MTDSLDPEPFDAEKFNHDPEYRWEYLKAFVGFEKDDWEHLQSTEPILRPLIPEIVEGLYEVFLEYEPTAELYRNDEGNFELKLLEDRIDGFELWFERIFESDQEPDYLAYLTTVGEIHTERMGFETMVVDEAFLNPTFAWLQDRIKTELTREITNTERLGNCLVAWQKFFALQLSLFQLGYRD